MPLQSKSGVFKPADSPFFSLFEQNHVPSLEERKEIQELLAEKAAHLSYLNSQVPKRRSGKKHKVPAELRAELAYTRRWLDFHRALVSPWRQLPVEIMSEIFIFTLKYRGESDQLEPWIDDRVGTLLLCKICSAWRAIALRTPALWNTLSVLAFERQVYLQLLWDSHTHPDVMNSVVSVYSSHLHHTAELSIHGHYSGPQIGEPYPWLNIESEVNAPLLSTVVVRLPQGSLWSLRRVPMSQIFQIFEGGSNLRHLDINVDGPTVSSSAQSRLNMKSVTKLKITSYEYLGEFLEQAEFPSIVNFRIYYVDEWPGPPFYSFLSRSSCALTVLEFHECAISPEEITTCLQHSACKTLQLLFLDEPFPGDVDVLLRHLTYQGPKHAPCSNPNLKTIILHGISSTDGLLSEMAESRCLSNTLSSDQLGPVQLAEFRFSFLYRPGTHHSEDWKRLREIEKLTEPVVKFWWPAKNLTE
ncbi:hypothetical protein MSAN_01031700 [Mycena sanguinolenta]|uniref:F-box domain-containing protein n=1 Tax=Mycena sanguinolenta TaxID=230812 RepID=A0A8H6YSF8_9AGAR|nr:hypothetical protein MSAN_01031700 [Mycena sanguinolenta]